jgi:hypothetical protein
MGGTGDQQRACLPVCVSIALWIWIDDRLPRRYPGETASSRSKRGGRDSASTTQDDCVRASDVDVGAAFALAACLASRGRYLRYLGTFVQPLTHQDDTIAPLAAVPSRIGIGPVRERAQRRRVAAKGGWQGTIAPLGRAGFSGSQFPSLSPLQRDPARRQLRRLCHHCRTRGEKAVSETKVSLGELVGIGLWWNCKLHRPS